MSKSPDTVSRRGALVIHILVMRRRRCGFFFFAPNTMKPTKGTVTEAKKGIGYQSKVMTVKATLFNKAINRSTIIIIYMRNVLNAFRKMSKRKNFCSSVTCFFSICIRFFFLHRTRQSLQKEPLQRQRRNWLSIKGDATLFNKTICATCWVHFGRWIKEKIIFLYFLNVAFLVFGEDRKQRKAQLHCDQAILSCTILKNATGQRSTRHVIHCSRRCPGNEAYGYVGQQPTIRVWQTAETETQWTAHCATDMYSHRIHSLLYEEGPKHNFGLAAPLDRFGRGDILDTPDQIGRWSHPSQAVRLDSQLNAQRRQSSL